MCGENPKRLDRGICKHASIRQEARIIMSGGSFYPNKEAEQIVWLSNYQLKIPIHGPTCGIGSDELTSTDLDLHYAIWMLQHWHPATQNDAKESTRHKSYMLNALGTETATHPQPTQFPDPPPIPAPGILKRLFSQVARLKASLNFNDVIGQDLGIIAPASSVDHAVPEYTLTGELGPHGPRVRIDYKKYSHDGVWIESRVNGSDWVFLAVTTVKPYYDERPNANGNAHETREYRMRWWDKSEPHGEWSAVQKVVVGG